GSLLDEASCKKRKIVWDHYCSVKDSQVVFVPGRLGGGDARVALSVSTTLPSAPQLLEDESWDHQGTWGSSSSAPAAEQPAPGPPPPVATTPRVAPCARRTSRRRRASRRRPRP
ncbi:unnamed protein product, partial [Prorocentrum cordatum]